MKLSDKEIVKKLKKRNPGIYRELTTPKETKKPLPQKVLNDTVREAKRLSKGKTLLIPVMRNSFRVVCRAYLDQDLNAGLDIVAFKPNKSPSKLAEKRLVSCLEKMNTYGGAGELLEDTLWDELTRDKSFLDFKRKVMAFEEKVYDLEEGFAFNYSNDVCIYGDDY